MSMSMHTYTKSAVQFHIYFLSGRRIPLYIYKMNTSAFSRTTMMFSELVTDLTFNTLIAFIPNFKNRLACINFVLCFVLHLLRSNDTLFRCFLLIIDNFLSCFTYRQRCKLLNCEWSTKQALYTPNVYGSIFVRSLAAAVYTRSKSRQ